jgi:hypothetical protein
MVADYMNMMALPLVTPSVIDPCKIKEQSFNIIAMYGSEKRFSTLKYYRQ